MPSDLPLTYWDACVPLSYVNGIPERVQHIEPLMHKSGKEFQIVTSVLSITEVAFAATEQAKRVLDPDTEEKIAKLWRPGSPILIVDFYELIALRAQRLMRAAIIKGWSLKPADAIHLATADQLKVLEFHTYDNGLDKYSELTESKFPVIRPISPTPHLELKATPAPSAEPASPQGQTPPPARAPRTTE